jgi:hypothetical protein
MRITRLTLACILQAYLFFASGSFWWITVRLSYNPYIRNIIETEPQYLFMEIQSGSERGKLSSLTQILSFTKLVATATTSVSFQLRLENSEKDSELNMIRYWRSQSENQENILGKEAAQTINNHVSTLQRMRSLKVWEFLLKAWRFVLSYII